MRRKFSGKFHNNSLISCWQQFPINSNVIMLSVDNQQWGPFSISEVIYKQFSTRITLPPFNLISYKFWHVIFLIAFILRNSSLILVIYVSEVMLTNQL
jgi:hypothetical protein